MANMQDSGRGGKAGSQQGKQQASSGGRSEEQAQQRNEEQAQQGDDAGEEKIRPPAHNVKSEPHWDPTEPQRK